MLGTPFRFPCGLMVPNRIAKAAMTEKLANADGRPNRQHLRLYRRFAEGGAGLLFTGNALVDWRYLEALGNVVLENDSALEAFRAWAEAGRSCGGAVILQLNHAGRQVPRSVAERSVAPSAIPLRLGTFFSSPRALTEPEIGDIIERFGRAAQLAERANFSGVEVHAAHGYLVSQFLSPRVNQRSDAWGGPIVNRARFLVRILERIRSLVSSTFAVGVKLNVGDFIKGGLDPEDSLEVVRMLELLGVDFVELSGGTHELSASFGHGVTRGAAGQEAYFLQHARAIRRVSRIPLVLTGGFRSRAAMDAALGEDACDLVALARPLTLEPDLPRRILSGDSEAAHYRDFKLPEGPRAALIELAWCREQLVRMSKGRNPRPEASPRLALLRLLLTDYVRGRRRSTYAATRTNSLDRQTVVAPEQERVRPTCTARTLGLGRR